jgi:hypothetical protein
MKQLIALQLSLLLSSPSWGATFTMEGQLLDGGVAASNSYATTIEILDDGNVSLWSETTNLLVIDGNFFIEVGAVIPVSDDALVVGQSVRFVIDGETLSVMPLPTSTTAVAVRRAARARTTDLAGSLFGNDARTRLLQQNIGSAQVAVANVSGLPAGIADGDQGTNITATAPLSLSAGTLSLSPLSSGNISDGSVSGTAAGGILATGATAAVTSGGTVSINSRVVADGTITGAMASNLTAADVAGVNLYATASVDCGDASGTLTTSSFCRRTCARGCGFLEFAMLDCDGVNDANDPCICVSAVAGQEPAACRHTLVGRLIQ